jgi:hypothetical protein
VAEVVAKRLGLHLKTDLSFCSRAPRPLFQQDTLEPAVVVPELVDTPG